MSYVMKRAGGLSIFSWHLFEKFPKISLIQKLNNFESAEEEIICPGKWLVLKLVSSPFRIKCFRNNCEFSFVSVNFLAIKIYNNLFVRVIEIWLFDTQKRLIFPNKGPSLRFALNSAPSRMQRSPFIVSIDKLKANSIIPLDSLHHRIMFVFLRAFHLLF